MRINWLITFVTIGKIGLDPKAREVLKIADTTLWNHINDLEKYTGKTLINRRNKIDCLSEEGRKFLILAENIVNAYEEMEEQMFNSSSNIDYINISTTEIINIMWLIEFIEYINKKYPEIKVNIICENNLSEYAENLADIFIRPIHLNKDHIIKYWNIDHTFGLFASKDYLDNAPAINSTKDLLRHKIIAYGEGNFKQLKEFNWHIKGKFNKKLPIINPYMIINSTYSINRVVEKGMGIASLPIELIYKSNIIRVLPSITGPITKVGCYTKKNLKKSKANAVKIICEESYNFINEYTKRSLSKLHVVKY